MKGVNIIWMFLAGLAAALALAVFGPASERLSQRDELPPHAETSSAHDAIDEALSAPGSSASAGEDGSTAVTAPGPDIEETEDAEAAEDIDATRSVERVEDIDGAEDIEAAEGIGSAETRAALGAELQAMSEGYRNRMFLHAIRRRGHHCGSVVDARRGGEAVMVWRVVCGDARAYLIGIDSSGELDIEALRYGDPGGRVDTIQR